MLQNAIVLMFDSLQHNYLSCYGNDWIKTPNFERFSREGVLFENCYIEGLPTVPCRRAMHTGRYTLPVSGWVPLSMEDTTIADLCWGRPIDSAFIFDCAPCRLPKFGYSRGFDKVYFVHGHEVDQEFYANDPLYHLDPHDYISDHVLKNGDKLLGYEGIIEGTVHELSSYLKHRQYWKSEEDQDVAHVIKHAIKYLEQVDRNKQFYLWIDSFDPHEPWDSPSVYNPDLKCPYDPDYKGKDEFLPQAGMVEGMYTEPELNHIRMLYAEKVTMCDKYLGVFMDAVRRLGFEQNTLMMVVSDHGEPMGNGEHGHGLMRKARPWPYEELSHAPMMLRAPGVKAGQRIKSFVQSVDVAPTICDWLGIGVHPNMQGKSLLPLVRGEVSKLRDFAIAGYYQYSWSIITDDWSYIHWPKDTEGMSIQEIASDMYNLSTTETELTGCFMACAENAALQRQKNEAALDGADQWTCTPASETKVPAKDELYDRRVDRFQLNNIVDKHQDKAKELLVMLKTFMAELRAS